MRSSKKNIPVYVKPFQAIGMDDVATVGGKNASLGEMVQALVPRGIPVPPGFAVTVAGYWRFLDASGLREKIKTLLEGLDAHDVTQLAERGSAVRQAILDAEMPEDLAAVITEAYDKLVVESGKPDVAVRSSATAEDLPGASFAGQQESYLNIRSASELLLAVRRCFASLFTNRAIVYRTQNGFDHLKVGLSVGVQTMVRSDLASAGVLFTLDTESGFRDVVLINAAYGLGESVVQGKVNPDQFYVFKPTLRSGFKPIIGRRKGDKANKIVYGNHGQATVQVHVPPGDRERFCLSDEDVLTLARYGAEIENYYSTRVGKSQPMDIEWAKDGESGELFIVQARPETVQSQKDRALLEEYLLEPGGKELVHGLAVGSRIGQGAVRVLESVKEMDTFVDGEILVARMTDPDWVPIMKRASAIVTDSGGRTCHAAIVSRELGIPAVVGTREATKLLKDGQRVTVSCAEGDQGHVYEGTVAYTVSETRLNDFQKPHTKILMNLADPEQAFEHSFIPNDGVGLARLEFVFTSAVRVHPLALLHPSRIKDRATRQAINELTRDYDDKAAYMVDRLAEGVGRIAAAFYPKDVIVRASDFKTNEYAGLLGGAAFEPQEANPMIGWRGASRYYDPAYRDAFMLECKAFKKVREEMGLDNLVVMVPFCRTPEEGKQVLATMAAAGLERGKNGLRVFVMVEIPSNVILAEEFAALFDGFSIGSNDLTQLILGVDRDSEIVSRLYDEQSPAVLRAIRHVIRVGKEKGIKVGICGQAPSDDPRFAEFLVREGIESISLNPDTVYKTSVAILKTEQRLRKPRL